VTATYRLQLHAGFTFADAEAVLAGGVGQPDQAVLAAELAADPGVVDDVVAVHRARRRLQHR